MQKRSRDDCCNIIIHQHSLLILYFHYYLKFSDIKFIAAKLSAVIFIHQITQFVQILFLYIVLFATFTVV